VSSGFVGWGLLRSRALKQTGRLGIEEGRPELCMKKVRLSRDSAKLPRLGGFTPALWGAVLARLWGPFLFQKTISDGEIQNGRSELRGSPKAVPGGRQTVARLRVHQRHPDHSGQYPGRLFGSCHAVRGGRRENRGSCYDLRSARDATTLSSDGVMRPHAAARNVPVECALGRGLSIRRRAFPTLKPWPSHLPGCGQPFSCAFSLS
jgi:hypothetical protein